MAHSLIIESTSTTGKKIRKAITDVRPDVSNENLKTFGQMCNALTTNTYGSSVKVGKDELKPASALKTYSKIQYQIADMNGDYTDFPSGNVLNVAFGTLFNASKKSSNYYGCVFIMLFNEEGNREISGRNYEVVSVSVPDNGAAAYISTYEPDKFISFGIPTNEAKFLGDYKFRIPECDGYAPFEFTIRLTADS